MVNFHDPNGVYVGRDLGGRELDATPAAVARYMAGTEDRHPWYTGPSPFGGPVAPALLFHSEAYANLSWYLPNLFGNLHARQEWELFRPFCVGQKVRTHAIVVDRYRKRNRDYVVNEVVIADESGQWLQRSRTHQSFLIGEGEGGFAVDREREKRPERRFEVGSTGRALAPLVRTVTLAMCEAFSGPERNYHTDREIARALGFPDIVVQGMMSICFLSEMMTREFGEGWFCGGKLDVRLVNVLWAEETVRACGLVREELPEGDKVRAVCDVWCEKPDGTKTIVGVASALRR